MPGFSSNTLGYTVKVTNATTGIILAPTVAQAGAIIKINNAPFAGGSLPLSVGVNIISILVTAEDGITTNTYTVSVIRSGPPTALALSFSAVAENNAPNAVIGTFLTTDPDIGDTFSYSLVSGAGSTDNASFNITGNTLLIKGSTDYETKSNYSVRARTTDSEGLFIEGAFTISVTNVNEALTDIALSSSSPPENRPAGSLVGLLSTTDPDAGDTFTYSLVSGAGSADNTSFRISGNMLLMQVVADYETKNSYAIRIASTDAGGLSVQKAFIINIINENEAPTNLTLSNNTIAENNPVLATVGLLATTDPDAGDTATYSLVSGPGSDDNASFALNGSQLLIKVRTDYEAKHSYAVRIAATDSGGLSLSKAFTINITDVNEAPTNLTLSASTLVENNAVNALVGLLSTTDPDAGDTAVYSLVSGAGSHDNASFSVSGNALLIGVSADYETQPSYAIRLATTDSGGLSFEKAFVITITNVNEAPTGIALSPSSIIENNTVNGTVGLLTSTDADAGDTATYTLVPGTGGADNASFGISGSALTIGFKANFSTRSSYGVRVRCTDSGGLFFERAFPISIKKLNTAPVVASAIPAQTAVTKAPFTYAFPITAFSDADAGTVFTYSAAISDGTALPSWLSFSPSTRTFSGTPGIFDNGTLTLRVTATDNGTPLLSTSTTFLLTVLQNSTVTVEQPSGTYLTNGVSSVAFGSTPVGSTSSRTFVIRDTGSVDLINLGLTITGTSAADFSVSAPPVAPVAPGGTTTFTVAFTPGILGAKTAMLHVPGNGGTAFDIGLAGTGGGAGIAVDLSGGTLTVTPGSGVSLSLTVSRNLTSIRLYDPNNTLDPGTFGTLVDSHTVEIPSALVTGPLLIDGGSGDDAVTIDMSTGDAIPSGGIDFEAGPGNNALTITGGTTTTTTYDAGALANAGSIEFSGLISGIIDFTGVPAITDNVGAAERVFNLGDVAETTTLSNAGGGNMMLAATAGQSLTFTSPSSALAINGGTADDVVNIQSMDPTFHGDLSVLGGGGKDTINLNSSLSLSADNDLTLSAEAVNVAAGVSCLTAGAGTIDVTTNALIIDPSSSLISASNVTITTSPPGTLIDLGGASTTGTLGLVDAQLDCIFSPSLVIGDASSGALAVSAAIRRSAVTDLALNSGAAITLNAGINTGGGDMTINGSILTPLASGVDLSVGAISFGAGTHLAIALGGNTADTTYTQLSVAGMVDLNGSVLSLSGSYVPQPDDKFTLVNNDGTDAVVGTFNGLPEGALFAFNGGIMAIHYSGGSGNDVVLTLPPLLNSITPPVDGTYRESQALNFTVSYSKAVYVTGTPVLLLNIGGVMRSASYVSGSGTANLVFQYTVTSLDVDADGITLTSPILLNGGSIADVNGDAAPLSFTPPNTTGILVAGSVLFSAGTAAHADAAPGTVAGGASVGTWESIRSGMVIASTGALAFRGHLDTIGGVTTSNNQGIWKSPDGTAASTYLLARTGSAAPDSNGSLFDLLPLNPYINNLGQTTFVGFLRMGSGDVATGSDSGVWTELGSGANKLRLLLRKGEAVTGGTVTQVAPSGWVATSTPVSTAGPGYAAFSVQLNTTSSALLRLMVSTNAAVPPVTTVAPVTLVKQGDAAPGIGAATGGTFDGMVGNSNDPRIDGAGDVVFLGYLREGGAGIWYQSVGGVALNAVARTGETTPGLADTFAGFERPSLAATSGNVAFRAFMNTTAQAVWQGDPADPAHFTAIAKTGDTGLPGIPGGSKLWSIWSPFSSASGKVAFRVSLLDGASAETRAIVTDTDGTLKVIARAGDTAPGTAAETFVNFDHPIIGDGNQVAFSASTSSTYGIWKQAAGGGALSLVLKVGDTVTAGGGSRKIASFVIIGATSDDRLNEVKSMDVAGQILVFVTYDTNETGIMLTAR